MTKQMTSVYLTVTLYNSTRINSKINLQISKQAFVGALGDNIKTRLTDDNLSEIIHELQKRFVSGKVIEILIGNGYYGYNSRLTHKMKFMNNDTILALRSAFHTANGQAEHIETLIK